MKIVAPISAVDEVQPLVEAGADELYCGMVPVEWTERFRSAGVNRRIFGNLTNYDDLGRLIEQAGERGVAISLVLNAQHYAEEHMDALLELSHRFASLGGSALIVGDIGLLALLAAEGPAIRRHASSLLSCRNADAAAFHRELGAHRAIFPRDVTLAEMVRTVAATPGLEFEAFILNDGCVFEEGNCHTIHLPSRQGGPICIDGYETDHRRVDFGPLSDEERGRLEANEESYRQWLWYRFSCGFATTAQGLPFGPCGLCALPALAAEGVVAVKIAGREGNTGRKVQSVRMVRSTLDQVEAGRAVAATMAFAQGLRERPDLCRSGYMCYYREILADGRAP